MKSRRGWISFSCLLLVACAAASQAAAQSASPIYSWSHAIGDVQGGSSLDGWGTSFTGTNQSIALSNAVDGSLTIVESGIDDGANNGIGGNWGINDSFNRVKESFNARDGGGLDLFGLDALEIEIGHNGPNPVPVRVYSHVGPSSTNTALNGGADIVVNPGGVSTYSVSLAGLTPQQLTTLRTVGLEARSHTADGNLTWTVNEIRSVGAGAASRLIADHDDSGTDFDGVLSNFDDSHVIGRTNFGTKSTEGLSVTGGRLQWQENADGPGLALEYGGCDNCLVAEDFAARPHDLSNYKFAHVQVSVQSQQVGEPISVQVYQQNLGYSVFGTAPSQTIPANGQIHDLWFNVSGITNRDWVDTHGIDFGDHVGAAVFRVYHFEYHTVPEPTSAMLLLAGALAMCSVRRRTNG